MLLRRPSVALLWRCGGVAGAGGVTCVLGSLAGAVVGVGASARTVGEPLLGARRIEGVAGAGGRWACKAQPPPRALLSP